jgi:hypothetical protein
MAVFGHGDWTVRALSVVFAMFALGALTVLTVRVAGRRAGLVALVVTSVHPYFVRYASETRMYTLVMLEVCLGLLALDAWFRHGSRRAWLATMVATAALAATHYWGLYAIAATACCLGVSAWRARRAPRARRAATALGALAAGLALWAPWLPVLRFQSRHTGTPWTSPSSPIQALNVALHRATGDSVPALALSWLLVLALVLGLLGRSQPSASSDQHGEPHGEQHGLTVGGLGAGLALLFAIAYIASRATSSAFVARYTMVMFPVAMLIGAAGLARLRPRAVGAGLAAVAFVLGSTVSVRQVDGVRTRAPMFADVLEHTARPGDVVVYCPDQLGPSIARLLDRHDVPGLVQWTYPLRTPPARVDWVDYRERHEQASPAAFARAAVRAAGTDHAVWLVLSTTYPATQQACADLHRALLNLRGETPFVPDDPSWQDHDALWRLDAPVRSR